MSVAVAFNYDLLVESILRKAGIIRYSPGISIRRGQFEVGVVPLIKPHGSIDFDVLREGIIRGYRLQYPLTMFIERCDFPAQRLPRGELISARMAADLVLPSEYSWQAGFQWIRLGFDSFCQLAPSLTDCIFLGLSYWKCDRPELNRLLDALPRSCHVVIANPYPSEGMIEKARSTHGTNVSIWKCAPAATIGR